MNRPKDNGAKKSVQKETYYLYDQLILTKINGEEDREQQQLSNIFGKNIKWYNHFGKASTVSSMDAKRIKV